MNILQSCFFFVLKDRGAKGINVVRIGDQRIHSDVKCVSVDSLVDKARDGNYPGLIHHFQNQLDHDY